MEPSLDLIRDGLGRLPMGLRILQSDDVEGSIIDENLMRSWFKHEACWSPSLEEQSVKFGSGISLRTSEGFEYTFIHVVRDKIDRILKADFGGDDADNVGHKAIWKVKGPCIGNNRGCTVVTQFTTVSLECLFVFMGGGGIRIGISGQISIFLTELEKSMFVMAAPLKRCTGQKIRIILNSCRRWSHTRRLALQVSKARDNRCGLEEISTSTLSDLNEATASGR